MPQILIVDSDRENRQAIRSILEDSAYQYLSFLEADTAQRGEMILKQSKPNLIIQDLSLPDRDGLAFGQMVKGLYPNLPIIVITHLKMFDLVQRSINSGFSAYLLKPVLKSELIDTFDRLFVSELSKEIRPWVGNDSSNQKFETDLGNPIETVIRYLQLKFQEPITLQEAADLVYLSPSHFSRLFKSETGITFVEYLTQLRIEKSKSLLKMTSLPIEVIANNIGFSSSGYFATTFKRIVGQTPSEYRNLFHHFHKESRLQKL